MLSVFIKNLRTLVIPHINPTNRENAYRFFLVSAITLVNGLDLLAKLKLDVFGTRRLTAIERLFSQFGDQPITNVMQSASQSEEVMGEIYKELLWAVAEVVAVQLTFLLIDNVKKTLGHNFNESLKMRLREDIMQKWLLGNKQPEIAPAVKVTSPDAKQPVNLYGNLLSKVLVLPGSIGSLGLLIPDHAGKSRRRKSKAAMRESGGKVQNQSVAASSKGSDTLTSSRAPFVHLRNPATVLGKDLEDYASALMNTSHTLGSGLTSFASGIYGMWKFSGQGYQIPGSRFFIPGHLAIIAATIAAVKGLAQHYLFYERLNRLVKEYFNNLSDYTNSINNIYHYREQIGLLKGGRFELDNLQKYLDKIKSLGPQFVKLETIGEQFRNLLNLSEHIVGIALALSAFLAGNVTTVSDFFRSLTDNNRIGQIFGGFSEAMRSLATLNLAGEHVADFQAELNSKLGDNKRSLEVTIKGDQLVAKRVQIVRPNGENLIRAFSYRFPKGQVIWLSGATGAGKTTLTRAIAGLWEYGKGQIEVPADFHISPHDFYFPHSDLKASIFYPRKLETVSASEIKEADRLIKILGLTNVKPSNEASTGEKRRIGFIRALLSKAPFVTMDESFTNVDPFIKYLMGIELRAHVMRHETTVIIIEHNKPPTFDAHVAIEDGNFIICHDPSITTPSPPASPSQPGSVMEVTPALTPYAEASGDLLLKKGKKSQEITPVTSPIKYPSSAAVLPSANNQVEPPSITPIKAAGSLVFRPFTRSEAKKLHPNESMGKS